MKKIIPTLMIVLFSVTLNAQNSYSNLWEKVQKFEIDNLPKSALKIVEEIYAKAQKDNNSPQIIKCLFYKSKFSLTLEEDAQLKIINQFKKHIDNSKFPTKNVLENVLASLYLQYFNQNRWRFYNRTQTAQKVDVKDFRTWDLNTLFAEIHKQYNNSLKNATALQNIDIYKFADILNIVKGAKTYRPTLYDFLAYNVLDFYKTDETHITKPAYQFKIDNENLLSNAQTFVKLPLTTKDNLSLQFNALKIYQKLIAFHFKSNNLEALSVIDLERLQFVRHHGVFKNKDECYLETLKTTRQTYKNNEVSGLYAYEIAQEYHQKANYKDTKLRFKNREALTICKDIIKRFKDSNGAKKCYYLKQKILSKSLNITAEKYSPVNTYQKVLVNYKNIEKLYFSVYKISNKELKKLHKTYKEAKKLAFINTLTQTKKWSVALKNEQDYLPHSTEVIVPKLQQGRYLIVASEQAALSEKSIVGYTDIQITNLVLIENDVNGRDVYQIVDRNTGKPIAGVNVNLTNKYTYNKNYDKKLDKNFTTDKNGTFVFNANRYYGSVMAIANYKNDRAVFDRIYISEYHRYRKEKERVEIRTFLFTDRSIYRPGQTVYFKGISMEHFKKTSKVIPDENVFVAIRDVNGQKIKEFELTTNEFGSFSGECILPNSGLTGRFQIVATIEHRNEYFSFLVEEYKRPKFETDFKPITETFKINDSITVNGFAKAFSGANITDAKVVYRVRRKVQYPDWWYWYRRPSASSQRQEITHGETTSDEKGAFKIIFKALPDESVDKKSLPVFTYEITADVTDVNGETRSASTIVKVGYHSLLADINMDKRLSISKKKHLITIHTKNLNDEFVPTKGTITIYKLKAPKNPLRKRTWNAVDYQVINKKEFKEKFPYDAYKNEDNYIYWEKGENIFTADFDTGKSKEIVLKNIKNQKTGNYIVELTTDKTKSSSPLAKKYISLFSEKEKLPVDNELLSVTTDKENYKIGDTATITIGTNAKDITVMVSVEKQYSVVKTEYIHLHKNSKTIRIPITENDEGGLGVKWYCVQHNAFVRGGMLIKVPYPKTDLEIITQTFRDKLQPGANQTWSFTVKGAKKDKVFAEVLANMYDASLDAFIPNNRTFTPINKPLYHIYNTAKGNNSFGNKHLKMLNPEKNYYPFPSNVQNTLNWFGFSFVNNYWIKKKYLQNLILQRISYDTTISGVVKDLTDGLPGVSVLIKGTAYGTETDFDGNFKLKVKKGDVLIFSFIGMKTVEKTVTDFEKMTVIMEEGTNLLEEVVVTGYGGKDKKRGNAKEILMRGAKSVAVAEIAADEEEMSETTSNDTLMGVAKTEDKSLKGIKARKNLQETAFFYPHLTTDKNGNISFNFTMPEALTKWKLQLLAHTKELHSATKTLETVTQKELMVIPNAPRFLRQGDMIMINTKIANLSDKKLQGLAQLILTDAVTGKEVNLLKKSNETQSFTVDENGNTNVFWKLSIPNSIDAVQYKVVAKADDFSDGEQNVLPVLSNRMLVTETLPMWVRSNQSKTFRLKKLFESQRAKDNHQEQTLKHHKLTLEMTSNPAWYAVQSLPYLMEYPYECSEQTFSRYYANTLASYIVNFNPRVQEVFDAWKNSNALLSNLEKNQELKSLIIQETPWLRDAQSETEQKKRIALLFDLNKMKKEQDKAIRKLKHTQLRNGGFPWFKGNYYPSPYITQHIASGFGHLKKLGVVKFSNDVKRMVNKAVTFMDNVLVDNYQQLMEQAKIIKAKKGIKKYKEFLAEKHIGYFELQYLYMRSFYTDISISKKTQKAIDYYKNQSVTYWKRFNLYGQGLIALVQFRNGNKLVATKIVKSLKENSITSEEMGMYWKSNQPSWYWYQSPIETQALLIEVFSEVEKDIKTIDNLKIWLLKNKQVSRWKTTKATTEAVYALLLQGSDWISVTDMVAITLGDTKIEPTKIPNVKIEAGTGYFKTSFAGDEITPKMGEVTISKKGKGIAWGGLYWQYFENLDKITSAKTPLHLKKKLFKKVNSDTGKKLIEVTDKTILKVGDLLTVRIELRSDRTMEFVHMKDMRASGVEPVNVLSKYKWQDGLGYYESTKDASTNFFFDRLTKGVYVFEYDVRVNNAGNFSNGITTIESMYAPEFKSHSEGSRINVE